MTVVWYSVLVQAIMLAGCGGSGLPIASIQFDGGAPGRDAGGWWCALDESQPLGLGAVVRKPGGACTPPEAVAGGTFAAFVAPFVALEITLPGQAPGEYQITTGMGASYTDPEHGSLDRLSGSADYTDAGDEWSITFNLTDARTGERVVGRLHGSM